MYPASLKRAALTNVIWIHDFVKFVSICMMPPMQPANQASNRIYLHSNSSLFFTALVTLYTETQSLTPNKQQWLEKAETWTRSVFCSPFSFLFVIAFVSDADWNCEHDPHSLECIWKYQKLLKKSSTSWTGSTTTSKSRISGVWFKLQVSLNLNLGRTRPNKCEWL